VEEFEQKGKNGKNGEVEEKKNAKRKILFVRKNRYSLVHVGNFV